MRNHPVNFVDVDTSKACVKKPFTSMIIGFGETGRDAFRFLYEFGALIDVNGNRNPQKIYVVDEHIDELKGDFLMKAPALKERKMSWNGVKKCLSIPKVFGKNSLKSFMI